MLTPGARVAGYRIEAVLGRGGMGVVYEATQLELDRRVAFKVLTPELERDERFFARFRREGRLQASIEHPHIVPVYEAGQSPVGLFLAMRLIRGVDLKALLRRETVDPGRAMSILSPIGDALDAAHAAGLLHRDVKPQNILVGPDEHAFLADFGLGKVAGLTGLTESGELAGTPPTSRPSRSRGSRPPPPATSIPSRQSSTRR